MQIAQQQSSFDCFAKVVAHRCDGVRQQASILVLLVFVSCDVFAKMPTSSLKHFFFLLNRVYLKCKTQISKWLKRKLSSSILLFKSK